MTRLRIALAVLGMLVAGAALLVHLTGLAFSCFDTNYCAQTSEKNGFYAGQLLNYPDRPVEPYANRTFYVRFESRDESDLPPVPFHTDAAGNFCVVWAHDYIASVWADRDGLAAALTPRGERVAYRGQSRIGLLLWTPGHPPGCEESEEGIPWNRAEDLASSWQSWLLIILPVSAFTLLLASIWRRRADRARWLNLAGLILAAANAVALLILWSLL